MARNTYNRRLLDAIISGKDTSAITSKKLVQSMESESQIQQKCIQWFQYTYPELWRDGMLYHNANEGMGAHAIKHGNLWVVCYSFEEFEKVVTDYLSTD